MSDGLTMLVPLSCACFPVLCLSAGRPASTGAVLRSAVKSAMAEDACRRLCGGSRNLDARSSLETPKQAGPAPRDSWQRWRAVAAAVESVWSCLLLVALALRLCAAARLRKGP